MELAQLEAFVQVANHRSFSRAAEALFLTQPSVTARIQSLERELSERLFERNGRTVVLTDAGGAFLPHALRALQAVEEGKESLEGIRNTEFGSLRLGSAMTVCAYVLPKILKQFHQRYPGLSVSVRTGRTEHMLEALLQDEVQVATVRNLSHPEVHTIQLYSDEVVLVSDAEHTFARNRRATILEVAEQPLIFFDKASSYYSLIHSAFRQAGAIPQQAMELDSLEATKKMVEEGLGIALLPKVSVMRELKLGTLVEVKVTDMPPVRREIGLMFRRRRKLSRPVVAFVKFLQEMYQFEMPAQANEIMSPK